MPDQIHVSPTGVKYRLIGRRATTPSSDNEAKRIRAQTDSVEVIVSDSRLISRGSQFGHVAIIVNGVAYSRAHEGYDDKKTHAQYVTIQQSFRNSVGYVVRVSAEERNKIETELKRRVDASSRDPAKQGYSLLDNSCSSNVADVLNLVGIVAYDPRWSAFGMVSPEDIAVGLSRSKRVTEKRFYAKEGS